MQKSSILLFVTVAVVLLMAFQYENILRKENSLNQKIHGKTVEEAVEKSILWASDEQIRRLVKAVDEKYGSEINQISRMYYTSSKDIKAIAIVESLIDEKAESGEGAVGLMGVKRGTGKDMGFDDVAHPINNLKAGTKYYKMLLKKFKDRELALAAYNLGPREVESRLNDGFNPETMDYIWKIRRVKQFMM
jgi:soluble lytic murein transglycosylase-like protein